MYNEYEIRPIPLSVAHCRRQVERFLEANALRLDDVDYYAAVFRMGDEEDILAGGGLSGDVIKCIAVNDELREEGFSSRLVSHLMSEAHQQGHSSVKVFTKPENRPIFEALGFTLIAQAQKAVLMENGDGLRKYSRYLQTLCPHSLESPKSPQSSCQVCGDGAAAIAAAPAVIVMNANPFTLGHRYLIGQAALQSSPLYVIVVKEDKSAFPYAERLAMVRKGTQDIPGVIVCEGSSYAVSSVTFPTYFLKELTDATDTQITLDLDLFARHIAPALNASTRFIGSEPTDPLTARYNELMKELLPQRGINVIEIPRLKTGPSPQGTASPAQGIISASQVRRHLHAGILSKALPLVPPTTVPYLLADLATQALQQELDTTPKPGLVDLHDNGAHQDMDYQLMEKSIQVLRPYFAQMAEGETPLRQVGIAAEHAMLHATHGTNTHKGALFSVGITIAAAAQLLRKSLSITEVSLQKEIIEIARQFPDTQGTHGAMVKRKFNISGALENARQGYPELFADWLPFYRRHDGDEYQCHKTLLRIMSTLDDTNIYYRKGKETAETVKQEARHALEETTRDAVSSTLLKDLRQMNARYIADGISPGGAADMLSLTIFISSITF